VLRAIDKLDRLGLDGVRLLLGPGRKDESGDFTKGAGLGEQDSSRLLGLVDAVSSALGASPVAGEALRDAFRAAIDKLDELGSRRIGELLREENAPMRPRRRRRRSPTTRRSAPFSIICARITSSRAAIPRPATPAALGSKPPTPATR
jgi:hypothetical protein